MTNRTAAMRSACSEAIYEVGRANANVIALTADQDKTFDRFKQEIPERFITTGISEPNMVGMAAGLAHGGKIPYVTSIAGILVLRAAEQIKDDVCYNQLPVRIVGHGAGISYGPLGPTHHCITDLALMRALPGMTVIAPADAIEAAKAIRASVSYPGPIYIRIGTGDDPLVYDDESGHEFQIGRPVVLREGGDVTIFATGTCVLSALQAADLLAADGLSTTIVNIHTVKPLDVEAVHRHAAGAAAIVSVEEHNQHGGLGAALAEVLIGRVSAPMKILGVPDRFSAVAGRETLYQQYELDGAGVAKQALALIQKGRTDALPNSGSNGPESQ